MAITADFRHEFGSLKLLRASTVVQLTSMPVTLVPGLVAACDTAEFDGIAADREHERDRWSLALAARAATKRDRDVTVHLTAHEVGHRAGKRSYWPPTSGTRPHVMASMYGCVKACGMGAKCGGYSSGAGGDKAYDRPSTAVCPRRKRPRSRPRRRAA